MQKKDLQKEQLEKLVKEMEQKLVQRDNTIDEKEKKKARKIRKIQLILRKQREKEKYLREQKLKQEEEKLFYENKYKSQSEMNVENTDVINKLRERYKGALEEIKDLENEHELQNSDLLSTVRDQEHEVKLLQGTLSMLLSDNEIAKVRSKCLFEEETQEWEIPPFYLQSKEVQFPKLNANKVNEMVEQELEKRDLVFGNPSLKDNSIEMVQNDDDKINIDVTQPISQHKYGSMRDDMKSTNSNYHSSGHINNNRKYLANSNNLAPMSTKKNLNSFSNPSKSPRYNEILQNKVAKNKPGKLSSLGHQPPPNPFGNDSPIDLATLDQQKLREHLSTDPKNSPLHPSLLAGSPISRTSKLRNKLKPINKNK